jgi:tetratricopeptide (TPR) repeat protein
VAAAGKTSCFARPVTLDSALHRYEEELQLAQRAVAHDPLNAWNYHALAVAQGAHGRLSEAEASYRKALELNPTGAGLHALLGDVLLAKGEPTAALAEMERETDDPKRQFSVPFALDALGRKSEADAEMAKLERKYGTQMAYFFAEFYACRKDLDRAISWLERGFNQVTYDDVTTNRFCMKNLDSDPRYKALLRKMNLPE